MMLKSNPGPEIASRPLKLGDSPIFTEQKKVPQKDRGTGAYGQRPNLTATLQPEQSCISTDGRRVDRYGLFGHEAQQIMRTARLGTGA